jgi:release factor glutamine methyltransferase
VLLRAGFSAGRLCDDGFFISCLVTTMRVKELYNSAVQRLTAVAIIDPQLEARVLLGHTLRISPVQLFLAAEQEVTSSQIDQFEKLLERRLLREPIAYILGTCEFWSLTFRVTKDVLIPRPETEFLLETVLQAVRQAGNEVLGPIADLGTGSGVIAIVLAREMSEWPEIYGVDCSMAALRIAKVNADLHGVAGRVRFINADLCTAFAANQQFGLIVANPPYVEQDLFADSAFGSGNSLQPEVILHEPRLALDGGRQGGEVMARIAAALPAVLKPGGWFFMEIGAGQADFVMALFRARVCLEAMHVYHDYAGLPRVFQARRQRVHSSRE